MTRKNKYKNSPHVAQHRMGTVFFMALAWEPNPSRGFGSKTTCYAGGINA